MHIVLVAQQLELLMNWHNGGEAFKQLHLVRQHVSRLEFVVKIQEVLHEQLDEARVRRQIVADRYSAAAYVHFDVTPLIRALTHVLTSFSTQHAKYMSQ